MLRLAWHSTQTRYALPARDPGNEPDPTRIDELFSRWDAAPNREAKQAVILAASVTEVGPLLDRIERSRPLPPRRTRR